MRLSVRTALSEKLRDAADKELRMRDVILFIAMSLDGYIADAEGNVDWLEGQGDDTETIDSYSELVKEIDTVVMGWNTYHQIVTELSPDDWIYRDFKTYVLTHRKCTSSENICFTDIGAAGLVEKLRAEDGKAVWICGGADVIGQLADRDLIDRYDITIIPTILGSGIRLFGTVKREIQLRLVESRSYDGMTELIYTRRKINRDR